ncbi:L-seryl-tRNA(Sec) selenium transferase [candidate division KSB1 bacterium]|nr:L-seryl-tRNA(Sec) selenium transferase [candidate division KSB1 bacterium]
MKPKNPIQKKLAQLPQVDKLLQMPEIEKLSGQYPRTLVTEIVREELEAARAAILSDSVHAPDFEIGSLISRVVATVEQRMQPSMRRAINASGIVLHTGLGRSPLSDSAKAALIDAAENFSTLEIDLESGKRGSRYVHVEQLLCQLTGAEAAMVVNNNAAATFLVMNTLSRGKESIVSRGELITIGGSFRLPEIMKQSGAIMIDVGTTNHTYLEDYQDAITDNTAMLLKIHTSNYKITGFTREVDLSALVRLGREFDLAVYHDAGSGSLIDLSRYGLPKEPVISESIETGADVVSFSGDKLLGGPQAGIIVGKKQLIDRLKKNHLTRILRAGKLTYAALEATLKLFFDESHLLKTHSVMRLLTKPVDQMKLLAKQLIQGVNRVSNGRISAHSEEGLSEIGGGSLATESLPTILVFLDLDGMSSDELSHHLRMSRPPIIGRITKNRVCLDMRTIREDEADLIIAAIETIAKGDI